MSLAKTTITSVYTSAGSILDISKYRDTCERSISILDGIAILRYVSYIDQSNDIWAILIFVRSGISSFDTSIVTARHGS